MFSASFAETPAEKVERLRQESAAAEENVEAHEAAVQTAANQKEAYTQKVEAIQQQIEIQKQLVIAQQDVLDAACKATADKLLETERTRALFEDRLVAMYIRHNNSDLATLLSVSTFAEAVRYIDNLRAIAQSDTELLETLRKQSEELAARQAEEEAAYQQLQADQAALEQQGAELADALQKAEAAYSKEQADLAAAQATATQTGEELKKRKRNTLRGWRRTTTVRRNLQTACFSGPCRVIQESRHHSDGALSTESRIFTGALIFPRRRERAFMRPRAALSRSTPIRVTATA